MVVSATCLLVLAILLPLVLKPKLAPAQAANPVSALTVELVTPEARTWPLQLQTNGAVAAWEEIAVGPETGGLRVAQLLVDVGQRVAKGQLLAQLADDTVRAEVAKQEALVAQAEASLLQASGNLKRALAVDVAGAIAPQKLDEYKTTEASARASLASAQADLQSATLKLGQTRIVAPDAGIVASKSGVVGNVVSSGTELYRLIRQGRLEWRAELDAKQLAQVREGQSAQVVLPGGQTVAGKVRLVSPTLSTTTGRGITYVRLLPDSPAKAGVFASGTIELQQLRALTLPDAAVVLRDGRSYIYVVGGDGKAASRPVTTGRRHGDRVEVVAGLDASTRVVAKGGAFLSDGVQVTIDKGQGASEKETSR
ncbi:hemolysin secretion protein D [Ramlibacter tataouinensis]|uniref:Hemolysin secretion protein D n=1 Tax=Ramlibacter tataouinensis TaxID=94132 RepID=A0A127JZQ3_9BURK|nr:hemolysin secretion protein D [Ramlibacter tataouinensis]